MKIWAEGYTSQSQDDAILSILLNENHESVTNNLDWVVDQLKVEFQIMRGDLNEMKADLSIELEKQFILLFQRLTVATIIICATAVGVLSMVINVATRA